MRRQQNRSDSGDIVAKLKARLIDHAFPLWSTEDGIARPAALSIDSRLVVSQTAWHRGACLSKPGRSTASPGAPDLAGIREDREIALKGLEYLLAKAKSPDGRPSFVHTLSHDGNVLDLLRDTYDHAFVILALASAYALDHDAQIRAEIDVLCCYLAELRSPHGGFLEGSPASMPRRQNPQMHLFEAMIAAFDATHDTVFQNRAGDAIDANEVISLGLLAITELGPDDHEAPNNRLRAANPDSSRSTRWPCCEALRPSCLR